MMVVMMLMLMLMMMMMTMMMVVVIVMITMIHIILYGDMYLFETKTKTYACSFKGVG